MIIDNYCIDYKATEFQTLEIDEDAYKKWCDDNHRKLISHRSLIDYIDGEKRPKYIKLLDTYSSDYDYEESYFEDEDEVESILSETFEDGD